MNKTNGVKVIYGKKKIGAIFFIIYYPSTHWYQVIKLSKNNTFNWIKK